LSQPSIKEETQHFSGFKDGICLNFGLEGQNPRKILEIFEKVLVAAHFSNKSIRHLREKVSTVKRTWSLSP
jgi:hypothetical protein